MKQHLNGNAVTPPRRGRAIAGAAILASAMALAGCADGTDTDTGASGEITLTLSAWNLESSPEFQAIVDGFEEKYPDVTVELAEYDLTNYNKLITADVAAGTAPDIITQNQVQYVPVFQEAGQLLDVSDVSLPEGIRGADSYKIDGVAYATPYRMDTWVLFYNKDLLDLAGVEYPDGSWTWDDYADVATELTAKLTAAGSTAKGTYLHSWQSLVQGFATAQAPGADMFSADYEYFEPFYESALALQDSGVQESFNTITANQLNYRGVFGSQQAALLPMGSWYYGILLQQQVSGEAQDFNWAVAPAPQLDASTAGTDNTPLTFGDPTGFGINANIDESKIQAAKEFLEYASSEDAAIALAKIGVLPAYVDDDVLNAYFSTDGAPADELTKFALQTGDVAPQNPPVAETAAVQNILNDMHTAIMSESESVDSAIKAAEDRVKNEVGVD
ncbi:MAG: extracellular solute-binding protein [Protaetiibacter sp.]